MPALFVKRGRPAGAGAAPYLVAEAAGFTAMAAGAAPEAAVLAAAACFLSCFLACIGLDAAAAGAAAIIGADAVIAGLAGIAAGVWANDRLAAEANRAAMSRDLVMVGFPDQTRFAGGSDSGERALHLPGLCLQRRVYPDG